MAQSAINQKLDEVAAHLSLLGAFLASSDQVILDEFNHFTSKQLSYNEEILALNWVPMITANSINEPAQWDKSVVIKQRMANGQWQPALFSNTYYPIKYIYPIKNMQDLLGFDLNSDLHIRDALNKAKILNELVLSEPFKLAPADEELSVLFISPVFGAPDIEGDFKGFVIALVSLAKLSEALSFDSGNEVAIGFTDINKADNKQALYSVEHDSMTLLKDYQLLIGHRLWQVEIYQPKTQSTWLIYWLAQIVGMLFVWLLIMFLISVVATNVRIREQVAKQTLTLRQEKQKADEASEIKVSFS